MVCSRGSRASSARSTVSPPTPLSNTPMGAPAFTPRCLSRQGFGAHPHAGIGADRDETGSGVVRAIHGGEPAIHGAEADDGEGVRAWIQRADRAAVGSRRAAVQQLEAGAACAIGVGI